MQDWDDLRFFLAVAREGTVSGAAKRLAVNYSTVIRRITHFEEKAGHALFERTPHGYELTAEGNSLLESAGQIEEQFLGLERQLYGNNTRLNGTIRIGLTEHLASLLMDDLADFSRQHPDIELQLMTNLEEINLARRDADIALRFTNSPPEHLVCRKVTTVEANIYAAQSYLKFADEGLELTDHSWIGWDEQYAGGTTAKYIENYLPEGVSVGCRVNSGMALNNAMCAGLGIGYMWCFVAEQCSELTKLRPELENVSMGLWVLLHKDLMNTARIKVFSIFIEQALQQKLGGTNQRLA